MCASHHLDPPIGFVTQPTNHSSLDFEAQTKKQSQWFWGPNHQTVAVGFEAQTRKPEATDFKAKLGETIDLGFEAKSRNPRFSSPCAWWRLHTASIDLSIVQPLSTWPLLDHLQFFAPGLLLLPWSSSLPTMSHLPSTHHETSKCDYLHKIDNKGRTT
jgi:hypothetical protein